MLSTSAWSLGQILLQIDNWCMLLLLWWLLQIAELVKWNFQFYYLLGREWINLHFYLTIAYEKRKDNIQNNENWGLTTQFNQSVKAESTYRCHNRYTLVLALSCSI